MDDLREQLIPRVEPLDGDQVAIWALDLELAMGTAGLDQVLSADERNRAARFVFTKDRSQYVTTRAILRVLLGAYAGCAPADITFSYGPYGKPELEGPTKDKLRFNVSHSHSAALLAFTLNRRVGVDIEYRKKDLDIDGLAPSVLSPEEEGKLEILTLEGRISAFYSYWTCKEAYVKAQGQGISLPLNRIIVKDVDSGKCHPISGPLTQELWVVRKITVQRNYAAAVAAEGQDWIVKRYEVPFQNWSEIIRRE